MQALSFRRMLGKLWRNNLICDGYVGSKGRNRDTDPCGQTLSQDRVQWIEQAYETIQFCLPQEVEGSQVSYTLNYLLPGAAPLQPWKTLRDRSVPDQTCTLSPALTLLPNQALLFPEQSCLCPRRPWDTLPTTDCDSTRLFVLQLY